METTDRPDELGRNPNAAVCISSSRNQSGPRLQEIERTVQAMLLEYNNSCNRRGSLSFKKVALETCKWEIITSEEGLLQDGWEGCWTIGEIRGRYNSQPKKSRSKYVSFWDQVTAKLGIVPLEVVILDYHLAVYGLYGAKCFIGIHPIDESVGIVVQKDTDSGLEIYTCPETLSRVASDLCGRKIERVCSSR